MKRFLLKWFVLSLAVLVTAYLIPGIVISGPLAAIIAALVLGLVNVFIRPLLIILTFPLTVITLGVFLLILNALLLELVAIVVDGFFVVSFLSAFFGSILISLVSGMINALIKR